MARLSAVVRLHRALGARRRRRSMPSAPAHGEAPNSNNLSRSSSRKRSGAQSAGCASPARPAQHGGAREGAGRPPSSPPRKLPRVPSKGRKRPSAAGSQGEPTPMPGGMCGAGRKVEQLRQHERERIMECVPHFCRGRGTHTTEQDWIDIIVMLGEMLLGRILSDSGICYSPGQAKTAVSRIKHVRYGKVKECYDAMRQGRRAVELFLEGKRAAAERRYAESRGMLQPIDLAKIDGLIQRELICGGGGGDEKVITAAAAQHLAKSIGITMSASTTRAAMKSLGYSYRALKTHYRMTQKRKKVIEDFIYDYSKWLQAEANGEVVIVYMDESYIHAQHKRKLGWDIVGRHCIEVNNALVAQQACDEVDPSRQGNTAGGKGARAVMVAAMTKHGIVADIDPSSAESLQKSRANAVGAEGDVSESKATSAWLWEARKGGVFKDYHANFDGGMFMAWVENRLEPAFRAMFHKDGKEPKMVLVLDNAPYHHTGVDGGTPIKQLNKSKPKKGAMRADGAPDSRTLLTVADELGVGELQVVRQSQVITVQKCDFQKGPRAGGLTKDELQSSLLLWISKNKPELLETRLQRRFRELGWHLLFTPPYNPKMQPIELLWRDTKNFGAMEWFSSRSSSKQSIRDILDFWFGAASSQHRGIKVEPLRPERFEKYCLAAQRAMDEWIDLNGVRCSGTVVSLKFNRSAKYKADGSIKAEPDAVDLEIEDDVDMADGDDDEAIEVEDDW